MNAFTSHVCPHCYTHEEYYGTSHDPCCSICGNYLNGEKALTAEEYYNQMGRVNGYTSIGDDR